MVQKRPILCPVCLVAEHPLDYVPAEGLAWTVEGDRYPSSVGEAVALMATALASEPEPITVESADNFSRALMLRRLRQGMAIG